MTSTRGVCEYDGMRARSAFIIALCLILVAVWGSGVHVHLSHDHASGLGHAEQDVHVTAASESGADHLAAHLHHGDVDLVCRLLLAAKDTTMKTPIALAMFV